MKTVSCGDLTDWKLLSWNAKSQTNLFPLIVSLSLRTLIIKKEKKVVNNKTQLHINTGIFIVAKAENTKLRKPNEIKMKMMGEAGRSYWLTAPLILCEVLLNMMGGVRAEPETWTQLLFSRRTSERLRMTSGVDRQDLLTFSPAPECWECGIISNIWRKGLYLAFE